VTSFTEEGDRDYSYMHAVGLPPFGSITRVPLWSRPSPSWAR